MSDFNEVRLRGKIVWKNRTELASGRKVLFVLSDGRYSFDCTAWDSLAEELKDIEAGSEVDIVGHLTSFTKREEKYPRTQIVVDKVSVLNDKQEFSF